MAVAQLTPSQAGTGASYLTDLLPGLLLTGLGVGLAFVAISVTAMSEVAHERAGLASGMLTTAHELGAAIGVAVFSAVALAGTGAADFASGYERGMLTAAACALALALVAAVTVPAARPGGSERVALH